MTDQTTIINQHVHRPPTSATWEHQHRWGTLVGDVTSLSVHRVDGGRLTISYGSESVEIRGELVEVFARMVAAAAVWTDSEATR